MSNKKCKLQISRYEERLLWLHIIREGKNAQPTESTEKMLLHILSFADRGLERER